MLIATGDERATRTAHVYRRLAAALTATLKQVLVVGYGDACWSRHRRFVVRSSLHARCKLPPPLRASSGRIRGDARSTDARVTRGAWRA